MESREDINQTYDCVFYPTFHGEYKVRAVFSRCQSSLNVPLGDYHIQRARSAEITVSRDRWFTRVSRWSRHTDQWSNTYAIAENPFGNLLLLFPIACNVNEPEYENLMETNIIAYERLTTEEVKITNLDDGEENDIFLHEDHLYFAHVSSSMGSFPSTCISFSSKRTLLRFKIISFAVRSPPVRSPIRPWTNTPSSLRSNHREPTAMTITTRTAYVLLILWYFFFILSLFSQDTSPLVYSLTDYRLKQKRPDFLDYTTAHPSQVVVSNSTTLSSTTSLSMDENARENKRLTSKWLVSDEIQVRRRSSGGSDVYRRDFILAFNGSMQTRNIDLNSDVTCIEMLFQWSSCCPIRQENRMRTCDIHGS